MKILKQGAIAAGLLALAACGGQTPAENAADNIEAASENQADLLEEMAANTTNEVVESGLEAGSRWHRGGAQARPDDDLLSDNTVTMRRVIRVNS